MAKKKQEEAPKGSPAWMATFSDLMNLLLCFFVLLFSMSSIEVSKFEEIAKEALAEPLKNCEVGTVEEQTERFRKFCFAHMKKGGGDFSCHKNCPAKNYIGGWGIPYCQLKWAQMPYEKEGVK